MSVLLPLCLVLSMITYSNAAYCVCKDGNEQVLQKAIDYACGAGADCSQIQQNGACFQPNTVKNHCDVAVNSYYQKKASSGATCDFNGAAVISTSPPSTASSCLTGSRRRKRLLTKAAIACKAQAMEKNHKKGHNKKGFNLKKHRKGDPRPTNKGGNDEKPVLFQLGSIAMVSDARLKADPEITNSIPASPSLSSSSSSGNNNAKERKLSELQSSSNTFGSQVSGVTHASSVEPALLSSPSVQLMDREGSDQVSQRNSLPILERNLSAVSNDSLFSLSIGDNGITRDELFSYRDFKAGELLKSSELLSFCPSVDVPVDSSDIGKSFDLEDKASELLESDSDDKSSTSEVSWRNLGDNSDEAPSSTQSVSSPITKKKKKKKKVKKKNTQQQKKRCSWLCCKDTGPCFSCCQWPNSDYDISCCKRLKYCLCCCGLPQCCFSSCSWFFCCCSSSSKKLIDDEIAMQKPQKAESKTSHNWFCCFPCCAS